MNKLILVLSVLLILSQVSALCNKNQINVNMDSKENLQKLYGIGISKSQAIIDSRPFESINNLMSVKGIGEKTLAKIKEQGLACVGEQNSNKKSTLNPIFTREKQTNKFILNLSEPIKISPKSIKSTNSQKSNEKGVPPKYLLWVFLALLFFLFMVKPRKRKNEWKG